MKFRIEVWSIEQLKEKYDKGKLNLNPPYQRKFIWSLNDQQTLIQSILKGYAIPNIFLFEYKVGFFEMVDGQQRTRTILGYIENQFKTSSGIFYNQLENKAILNQYVIPVTIIEKIEKNEFIEEFYSLVNKSGIHLNRPELKKAEYFDTKFLKLITELSNNENFQSLNLFTETTSKRMNDVDFISELVTYLIEGISDKKIKVDKVFENDISDEKYDKLKLRFESILSVFSLFDSIFPIKKTRYKQRNDLYTLFGFIDNNLTLKLDTLEYFYRLLLKFNDHINPSNEKCEPFQLYAFHCISQSNSKNAREERLKIISDIFLNNNKKPNKYQKSILNYFELKIDDLKILEGYLNISLEKLK
jgi:hypothetical protein